MNFIELSLANDRLRLHVEGDTAVELFSALADAQEVFSNLTCGACKSEDVRFVVRTVDDNKFHEMKCQACGARLSFGQHKKGGGLFPKRKITLEDGTEKFDYEHLGWAKWTPTKAVPAQAVTEVAPAGRGQNTQKTRR